MPKPLEIKDLGIGKLKKQLADLAKLSITFGYQGASGSAQHPGTPGVTIAQLAAFAEFGTENADARPLGRHTLVENRDLFREATKKVFAEIVDGRADPDVAVQGMGELTLQKLRETIARSREWAVENKKSTIDAKGHDQPLVGEFDSLTTNASWAVRRNGAIVRQGGEE